jgi:hypothetical protein
MHQPAALGRITALGVSLSRSEIERPGDRLTGSASRWRPVTDYGKSSMRPLRVFTQPGSIRVGRCRAQFGHNRMLAHGVDQTFERQLHRRQQPPIVSGGPRILVRKH